LKFVFIIFYPLIEKKWPSKHCWQNTLPYTSNLWNKTAN
jgi:hypothetical protein